MKISKLVISAAVLFAVGLSSVYAKKSAVQIPVIQEQFELNGINKQLGYQLIENGEKIVFVFDSARTKIEKPLRVFVEGSFNGWSKGKNTDWEMELLKGKIWLLEKDASEVKIPGNSGFPEFKFYVKAEIKYTETVCGKVLDRVKTDTFEPAASSKIPGFQMATNNLILFPEDNPMIVVENNKIAERKLKLKDFDLSKPEDVARISNVRLVPGTTKLWRGYHPYKISRPQFDTETTRINLVNYQIEANGIKTIITLSGNEQTKAKESVSNYVQNINYSGNHLAVDTSYNVVYYRSRTNEFGKLMAEIVQYIGNHPAPYYVHCRLGTDRTGAVSAYLAALCGATWEQITEDYQKSNETGIQEFRDYRLLQYSFEQLLDKPVSEVKDLQKEVQAYFVNRKFLTQAEIDAAVKKLTE